MPVKEFEFRTEAGQFVASLQQLLAYVEQQLILPLALKEQLLFESKVILTELLTNAIKHSGTAQTRLKIEIEDNGIVFIKRDTGVPMALLKNTDLSVLKQTIPITGDWMHTLQATLTGNNTLHFTCIEHDLSAASANTQNLQEHFGLLMMAKLADECSYRYDEGMGENVFTVIRKW